MFKVMTTVLALVLLACGAERAAAFGCSYPSYSYGYNYYPSYNYAPTYYPPTTYVTPVYAAVYLPVPVASVGYAGVATTTQTASVQPAAATAVSTPASVSPRAESPLPPHAAAGPSPCEKRLAAVESELAEIKALVKGRAPAPEEPVPRSAAPRPQPRANILTTACAACHGKDADKFAKDADGRVLRFFDDAGRLLAKAPTGKMNKWAYEGKMPPPPDSDYWKQHPEAPKVAPLSDDDYREFINELGEDAPAADPRKK